MIIKLENLELLTFDKNNKKHLIFLKKLINDQAVKDRLHGLGGNILHNRNNLVLGNSFFVQKDNELIGYINIGEFNDNEKAIYLKAAITFEYRGKGYGKLMLHEVSDYIFKNYLEVENIIVKIANDNKASIQTANSCNFKWLRDDFYIKTNPYLNKENFDIKK